MLLSECIHHEAPTRGVSFSTEFELEFSNLLSTSVPAQLDVVVSPQNKHSILSTKYHIPAFLTSLEYCNHERQVEGLVSSRRCLPPVCIRQSHNAPPPLMCHPPQRIDTCHTKRMFFITRFWLFVCIKIQRILIFVQQDIFQTSYTL